MSRAVGPRATMTTASAAPLVSTLAAPPRSGPSDFLPPRDAVEQRIARICVDVLGASDLGVTATLVALAGDVAATTVAGLIASEFGVSLSLPQLRAAPTVAGLACAVRARAPRSHTEPLVALQPRGTRRPFFLLPGGDGNVFNFHALARRMAPDRPLYGLQLRGFDGEEAPFARVEEQAAAHVAVIRSVVPHGPYLLGGHCSGSLVATEIALQLEQLGERVALLVALEGVAPSAFWYGEQLDFMVDDITFFAFIASGFKYWFGRELRIDREALEAVPPDRRAAHFMARARAIGVFPEDAPDARIEAIRRNFHDIVHRWWYRTQGALSAPIAFVRATGSDVCEGGADGWAKQTRAHLQVHEVPGNHVSLLTEPHVACTARLLERAFAAAESGAGR